LNEILYIGEGGIAEARVADIEPPSARRAFWALGQCVLQKHGPAVFIFLLLGVSSMTSKDRVPEKRR
jgi:hypothetical protein